MSRQQAADAAAWVPVRLVTDWQEGPDGRIVVRRRKFGRVGTAVLRMFRLRPDLTVHLDRLGSEAWRLADGRRTAGAIAGVLAERFPDERDVPARLGAYLSQLAAARLLRMDPPGRH